jgi:amino acid transporter
MILLGIIFSINLLSQSSSKTLGTVGMGIKTIPLFFVIISAFVFLGLGIANDLSLVGIPVPEIPLPEESFSITSAITSDSIGTYNATEGNGVSGILLAMPAILFTFDGFVFSASMQNEAKDQKTFMTA